jgi:hypothetical protein
LINARNVKHDHPNGGTEWRIKNRLKYEPILSTQKKVQIACIYFNTTRERWVIEWAGLWQLAWPLETHKKIELTLLIEEYFPDCGMGNTFVTKSQSLKTVKGKTDEFNAQLETLACPWRKKEENRRLIYLCRNQNSVTLGRVSRSEDSGSWSVAVCYLYSFLFKH